MSRSTTSPSWPCRPRRGLARTQTTKSFQKWSGCKTVDMSRVQRQRHSSDLALTTMTSASFEMFRVSSPIFMMRRTMFFGRPTCSPRKTRERDTAHQTSCSRPMLFDLCSPEGHGSMTTCMYIQLPFCTLMRVRASSCLRESNSS